MLSIAIACDATICGITYNCHSDDSRGVIYDRNMFMIQSTNVMATDPFLGKKVLMTSFLELSETSAQDGVYIRSGKTSQPVP